MNTKIRTRILTDDAAGLPDLRDTVHLMLESSVPVGRNADGATIRRSPVLATIMAETRVNPHKCSTPPSLAQVEDLERRVLATRRRLSA